MKSHSDAFSWVEVVVLNAVLVLAAWLGRLPIAFYVVAGITNIVPLFRMRCFFWWIDHPGSLKAGRFLVVAFCAAWLVAAIVRLVLFGAQML